LAGAGERDGGSPRDRRKQPEPNGHRRYRGWDLCSKEVVPRVALGRATASALPRLIRSAGRHVLRIAKPVLSDEALATRSVAPLVRGFYHEKEDRRHRRAIEVPL